MRAVRWFAFAAVLAASTVGTGCRTCCAPYDYNNPVPCAPNYSDSCARVNSRFSGYGGMTSGEEVIYEGDGEVIYEGAQASRGRPTLAQ